MTVASRHTQACFAAWINCEELLVSISQAKTTLSRKVTKVIDECAYICMGTFHALKSQSQNAGRFALLCIGICEECAELCEEFSSEEFLACARICRTCSRSISQIMQGL